MRWIVPFVLVGATMACLSGQPRASAHDGLHLSATLEGPAESVRAVVFSPDGRWIAAAMLGATKVWDVRTAKLVHAVGGPQNEWARGLRAVGWPFCLDRR